MNKIIIIVLIQLFLILGLSFAQDHRIVKNPKTNLFGLRNELTGELIVGYNYDGIQKISRDKPKGYYFIIKDKKWGMMDSLGNVLIPSENTSVSHSMDGSINTILDNKVSLYDNQGKLIKTVKYDSLVNGDLLEVNKGGKWGIISYKAEEIVPCKYGAIHSISRYRYQFKLNNKWGVNGIDGREIIPCKYDSIDLDNYARKYKGKWGLFNFNEEQVLPFEYDKIVSSCHSSNYLLKKETKWSAYNSDYKKVIGPFIYDSMVCDLWHRDFLAVRKNNKWGLLKKDVFEIGEALPIIFDSIIIENYYSIVKKEGKWGVAEYADTYFDSKKDEKKEELKKKLNIVKYLIQPQYDSVFSYSPYLKRAVAQIGNKWGLVNTKQEKVLAFNFDEVKPFNDGIGFDNEFTLIKLRNKYSLLNRELKEIIPFQYDSIVSKRDYNMVFLDGKCGLTGRKGKVLVECKYDDLIVPDYGYSFVSLSNEKYKLITFDYKTDNRFYSKEYDFIKSLNSDIHLCVLGQKYGVLSNNGEELIFPKYDYIEQSSYLSEDEFAIVAIASKYGVVSSQGKEIIPCEYDYIFHYNYDKKFKVRDEGKLFYLDLKGNKIEE